MYCLLCINYIIIILTICLFVHQAVREWLEQLDELVDLFAKVAAESREAKLMNLRKKRQKKMEDKLKVENSSSSQ